MGSQATYAFSGVDANHTIHSVYSTETTGGSDDPGADPDPDPDPESDPDPTYTCAPGGPGDLNVNPANSSGNIFSMTMANSNSDIMDINSMESSFNANGNADSYNGAATEVKIMVKAQGRSINIDGADVELLTNTRYTFSCNTGGMTCNLQNTHDSPNNWNQAKGHWWLAISGTGISITPDPPPAQQVSGN